MINNLPDISKAFGEEKTQEQILDSLQKYRKELNFLLMNLDEANMPAIAGRLDGLDGSFSLIDQQLDSITLAVGNAQGDISALQLRADGIDLSVSNLDGDLSALSITVDGISTTVSNHTGQISTINQTVSGIQTTVSSHNTLLGTHTSQITQLDSEISSIVSFTDVTGNQIASKINQTATTITISASKLDLTGVTAIYSPTDTRDYLTIDGSYVDFFLDNDNYLSISKGLLGALFTSPSEGRIWLGENVAVDGNLNVYDDISCWNLDVNNSMTVDGYKVVTADATVHIDTTTYGINIQSPAGQTISILWGASLS